jgi:hypothetical protein
LSPHIRPELWRSIGEAAERAAREKNTVSPPTTEVLSPRENADEGEPVAAPTVAGSLAPRQPVTAGFE